MELPASMGICCLSHCYLVGASLDCSTVLTSCSSPHPLWFLLLEPLTSPITSKLGNTPACTDGLDGYDLLAPVPSYSFSLRVISLALLRGQVLEETDTRPHWIGISLSRLHLHLVFILINLREF